MVAFSLCPLKICSIFYSKNSLKIVKVATHNFKEWRKKNYEMYWKNYSKNRELISLFERSSFKEKKDTLAELFLILEHDELLHGNIDSHEIARRIIKY